MSGVDDTKSVFDVGVVLHNLQEDLFGLQFAGRAVFRLDVGELDHRQDGWRAGGRSQRRRAAGSCPAFRLERVIAVKQDL